MTNTASAATTTAAINSRLFFLQRMMALLKPLVPEDQWAAVFAQARAHAGGKAKAAIAEQVAATAATAAPTDAVAASNNSVTLNVAPVSNPNSIQGQPLDHGAGSSMPAPEDQKLTQIEANYITSASDPAVGCATCKWFLPDMQACDLVQGTIVPTGVSALWQSAAEDMNPPVVMSDNSTSALLPHVRVFTELSFDGNADHLPEWIPLLPVPNKYVHPSWGEVDVTPEMNAELVKNFKDGFYQDQLPVDAEHELSLSGAMAYITDLRLNPNHSVSAKVAWTRNGAQVMQNGGYKYVSPAWYPKWQNPATKEWRNLVLNGAAITTRPFFKPPYLDKLVASESGVAIELPTGWTAQQGETMTAAMQPVQNGAGTATDAQGAQSTVDPAAPVTQDQFGQLVTVVGQVAQQVTDLSTKVDEFINKDQADDAAAGAGNQPPQQLPQAATERITAAESQLKTYQERIEQMEFKERDVRFSDLAKGRAEGKGGKRWFGETKIHVDQLHALQRAFGEDSTEFKNYVATQEAMAEALNTGKLFSEEGTNQSNPDETPKSVEEQLNQLAQKRATESAGKLDFAHAYQEVIREKPELYQQYNEEMLTKRAAR